MGLLSSDWLPERPILPTRDFPLCPAKQNKAKWQYSKSSIDKACSVKMAAHWSRSFFCILIDLGHVPLNKNAKKKLDNHDEAILTLHLVNNAHVKTEMN